MHTKIETIHRILTRLDIYRYFLKIKYAIIIIPPGYSRSILFLHKWSGSCHEATDLEDSMTRVVPGVNRVPVFVSRFRTSATNVVYVTFDLLAWRPAFNDIIRLYWTPWSFRPTWKINVSTRPTHRTRVYPRGMSQLALQRVSASRF